jgi:transcriptional regulator with XRE-family HTH domain
MQELADKCDLANASSILRIERGRDPYLSLALMIAAALEVPLSVLITEADCPTCEERPPAPFICPDCGRGRVAGDARSRSS